MATRDSDDLPQLLLVGEDEWLDEVSPGLGNLRAELRRSHGVDGVTASDLQDCLAVILVGLRRSGPLWRDVGALHEMTPLPLFVVTSDESSTERIRRCYDSGATGAFEWPREAASLERCVAEMLSIRLTRGPASRPDIALARAVRARLRLLVGLVEVPRLEVREGIVRASGAVESLALKRDVGECIAAVPGVRGVDTGALHVIPDPVPDEEIRQICRRLLRRSDRIDHRAVSSSVEAGCVVFTGSAEDGRELRRLAKLVANIRGVRDVRLNLVFPRHRGKPDRRAAGRLEEIVREVFPGGEVGLNLFGGVAVVTGRVHNLRTRQAIEAFLEEDPLVERVVNKLEVEP